MILSFDKFERYELPQVTLCNPNSRAIEVDGKITITDTVGVLSNPKGMNLKLNFNAPHELSFDYYRHKDTDPARVPVEYIVEILDINNKVVKQVGTLPSHEKAEKCVDEFDLSTLKDGEYLNIIKQSFYDNIYEAIQTDRYVYLTDIGYFIISSVTDSDEDNIDKKSITCKSCEENEFATAEGLYLEENTYYLHTNNNKGLIDLFVPKTTGWTLGFIDPTLLTKPYYVEKTDVDNGYNFLYTTIQDMFECIVEPDIIKRTVSFYSRTYYAQHHLTDIHIAKYNLLKHKTVEENDEDKYTALNVQGKDENLEIRTVNPTGKNIIYNFDPRHFMMSPKLQIAVVKWQEKCESVEDEYLTLQQGYYNDMQNIVFPLEQDIKALELQLKQEEQTRDTIVYGDYDKEKYDEIQEEALKQVNAEIQNTSIQISDKKSQLETENNRMQTNYSQPILNINLDCALDITAKDIDGNTIFTAELLNELMTHIKPTDYVDEYMLVTESMTYPQRFEKAKELMNRAQSQLVKISSGQKTYSIDTRSFLFNKQFRHFSEQLCAGAIIYIETKSDTMEQLHLTGIDINFDDKSTSFTLGNKYDKSDLKTLYDDALGKNSKSFTELKYVTELVNKNTQQLSNFDSYIKSISTLTLNHVLASEDESFEINNRGILGRVRQYEDGIPKVDGNDNPLFDPEQVKIIHNGLYLTQDNWRTASTALGKIVVDKDENEQPIYKYGIIGDVIIGNLFLGKELRLFGGTKTETKDGTEYSISLDQHGLTIVNDGTEAGIVIKDKEGNKQFYADEDGNLILNGTINANDGNIGDWTIKDGNLYSRSIFSVEDINGEVINTFTILRSQGDVNDAVLATMVPDGNSSIGATCQIFHNGSARFARRVRNITNDNNSAYAFTIDEGSVQSYVDAYISGDLDCAKNITLQGHLICAKTITVEKDSNFADSVIVGTSVVCGLYVRPSENGTGSVGNSNYKWNNIYAKTGTINTSDRNVKSNITELTDIYKQLFMRLIPVSFTFVDGTSGRTHIGFISQDVEEAMTELGMTSLDFAGFCKDIKTKIEIDETGNKTEVPDLDEFGNEQYLYALRYEEFIGIISYVLQDSVCKINSIEERLAKFEQTLTAG